MDKGIGPIFGENIFTGKSKKRSYSDQKKDRGLRSYLIPVLIAGVAFVIIIRLFFLQVVQGNYYRMLSDGNRVKTVVIHAPRGIIYDRNGTPLVYNVPGFRETVDGKTRLISQDEAINMIAEGDKELEIDSLRHYPENEAMAHVLGFLGQISEDELKNPTYTGYSMDSVIGKMGIEKEYEEFLRGTSGKQLAETDNQGKVIRKLGETDAIPGRDITLTIDAKLQKTAYDAIKDKEKGAVVVTTPQGEILALVSIPSFDPNLFTLGGDYKVGSESAYKTVEAILTDSDKQPFLNRAISGVYPPGSTYKIITSAAGLEDGTIDTNYSVEDTGILRIGEFSFSNWFYTSYGGKDGDVNVVKGLKRSNDIFFYKLAEKIGIEKLSDMSRKFMIDQELGIDLAGESKGTVPDDNWKRKNIGEMWYLGDTFHMGIGQGFLLSTPLHVNSWAEVIANGGDLYRPHLLKDLGYEVLRKDLLREVSIDPIRQGMIETCDSGGTAWPLFDFKVKNPNLKVDGKNILEAPASTTSAGFKDYKKITIACKTGTAEQGGDKDLPHAWITLFAPAYDPEIVITVLAEAAGEGSAEAAPIAKKILEDWFSR
jgi:penicillin-binding protein 2